MLTFKPPAFEGGENAPCTAFCMSVITSFPVLFVRKGAFSFLVNVPFLIFFTSTAKFSSKCTFLILPLHIYAPSLYYSQDSCSWFHCLCIFFLHFSLVLTDPGQTPALLVLFFTCGKWEFLCSKNNVLKDLPGLFRYFVPDGSSPGGPIH